MTNKPDNPPAFPTPGRSRPMADERYAEALIRPCDDKELEVALIEAVKIARTSKAKYVGDLLDEISVRNIVLQITEGSTILDDLIAKHVRARLAEAEGLRERYEIADWCNEQSLRLYHDERKRAEAAEAENARYKAALEEIAGCFNAAFAEGWIDALANGDLERLRDIWSRRINYAYEEALKGAPDAR
jgi:hypothetical protein